MGKNVFVTNGNEEAFHGRFDGQPYTFNPGEPRKIPVIAALFLFGYGSTDAERRAAMVRNGWLKVSDPEHPLGLKAATRRLKRFKFKAADDDVVVRPQPAKLPQLQTKSEPGGNGADPEAVAAPGPEGRPPGTPPPPGIPSFVQHA